ncbi:M14 family zinc carboxypeptidase [Chondrinema litorale]|uniref:M14 family zinc carboxypeptidase n=1 Tax=Chondrinema litorale TaxID=2994555 RepID=UPI0025436344|nr:M14 family zinc carboxypeptidase [Chondrinema litorale]UZR92777.1 M14 family zinc carboxypeptidase [Chondrinema litorale]
MYRILRISLFFLLVGLIYSKTTAQKLNLIPERFAFDPEITFDEDIQSPADFLGYELGETYTIYHQSVAYVNALAASSSKITVHEYGKTYEDRPLVYMVITSEKNQQRIEEIRENNLKLADPINTPSSEAEDYIKNDPVIISYSYNIHGNEASSTEAAMQVAYRLVAATDEGTANLLDNAVMVLYLCINPDGRDRFVYWYKSAESNVVATDPYELEHDAPWPNGRTNHYWFDLNRDWVWGVHPESRGHASVYQEWMSQVHTDYHEQGYNNNYFTVPGTTPRNKLLPDQYEVLADTIGKANIEAFNKHNIMYFTREAFDFFYPGYGSSYPSVMGAIGMLTEQGGIGSGRAIETEDGYILRLRQKIFDHYQTSLATIKKVVERKEIFKQYFYNALNPANSKSSNKSYILPDDNSSYLYELIGTLLRHGVKVEKTTQNISSKSGFTNYRTGKSESKTFSTGTYIISANQPKHLFIHTIFERQMEIEDSVMYDMATWSAPLAYNLEAFTSAQALNVQTEAVTEKPALPSGVNNPDAAYAYVIEWKQRFAPKALSMLWEMGYKVRSASKKFSDGKKTFYEGTLVVLIGRNLEKKEDIEADMQEIAKKANVTIDGFDTGRMLTGLDLGSGNMRPVKQPKVAMLVDNPFNSYTAGQIWFLFDQDTELPISKIRASSLSQSSLSQFGRRYGSANLFDYDVLIMPGASPNNLKEVFDAEAIEDIKQWVQSGGVLIATENASTFFTSKHSGFTNVELAEMPKDSSDVAKFVKYKDLTDYNGLKRIPGTALNTIIDNTNPLAFGMTDKLYSLKFGNDGFEPAAGIQTVGYYDMDISNILASGYASKENLEHLKGKANNVVVPMGKGKVVLMLDNTQYRMFWRGPSRMMQNAVMLLKGM